MKNNNKKHTIRAKKYRKQTISKKHSGLNGIITNKAVYFTSILIAFILFNLFVISTKRSSQTATVTTTTNKNLIYFWKYFLSDHPNYLPGWIELAYLELENKNIDGAKTAYDKANEINPNINEVKELKNKLGD